MSITPWGVEDFSEDMSDTELGTHSLTFLSSLCPKFSFSGGNLRWALKKREMIG